MVPLEDELNKCGFSSLEKGPLQRGMTQATQTQTTGQKGCHLVLTATCERGRTASALEGAEWKWKRRSTVSQMFNVTVPGQASRKGWVASWTVQNNELQLPKYWALHPVLERLGEHHICLLCFYIPLLETGPLHRWAFGLNKDRRFQVLMQNIEQLSTRNARELSQNWKGTVYPRHFGTGL